MKTVETDLIERLMAEWAAERPDFDTSGMAIVGRIMRLGSAYLAEAEAALKPHGLRYTEFDILATMRRSGKPYRLTPARLCDSVLLTSGAMTAALDRLEAAGFITRESDPNDRRVKAAKLTVLGKKTAEAAAQSRFETAKRSVKALSEAEMSALVTYLRKL